MPSNTPEMIQRIVYEGVLGWRWAAGLLFVLALLMGWLLWRERTVTGRPNAVLFFLLRVVALGLVLWMLLEPTRLAIERVAVPKTIAIAIDTSDSMQTAELMPAIDEQRWRLVGTGEASNESTLAESDIALVSLRCTGSALRRVELAIEEYSPAKQARAAMLVAKQAARGAAEHLARVGKLLEGDDSEAADAAMTIADDLRDQLIEPLAAMVDRWQTGTPAELDESADRVRTLQDDHEQLLRRGEVVSRSVAALSPAADGSPRSRRRHCLALMAQLEEAVLGELGQSVNIKRVAFDEYSTPLSEGQSWSDALASDNATAAQQPGSDWIGPSTNLATTLESLGRDAAAESIVAAFLISDGGHNTPGVADPQAVAAGMAGLPVYTVPIGSQEPQRDLELSRVEAPTAVAVRDRFAIEALVTGRYLEGEAVDVELRKDGQLVDRKSFEFDSDRQDHRVRFELEADELGRHEYDLVTPVLEDEASETNNAGVVAVRVVRDRVWLLLADRISRYEYRYLDQLFRRDKRVEFDKLLHMPELLATGGLQASKELPRDIEGWAEYDTAILGDLHPDAFDREQQRSLEAWVRERGGSVVVIAGSEHMPISYRRGPLLDLLPVQASPDMVPERNGYVPALTPEGARSEALLLADSGPESARLWSDQFRHVPVYYLSRFCRPKVSAHVWAGAMPLDQRSTGPREERPEQALLAWQDVGAGRVVYLASPVSWHLRFRRGDELHHRFWGQLLRWLTATDRGKRSSRVFVRTSDSTYDYGESVEVAVALNGQDGTPVREADVSAAAETLTGEPIIASLRADPKVPGRYLGRFEGLKPGAYRIVVAGEAAETLTEEDLDADGATALVNVVAPDNLELADPRGNLSLMRAIAESTGGQVLPPTAIAEVLRLSASEPSLIETATRTPLWNRWSYLWIVVGCLATEWTIRRRIGLV